jgi:hypothetical protein
MSSRTTLCSQPRTTFPVQWPHQMLTALVIPADTTRPINPVTVEASTRLYSDLLDGGLLEEIIAVLPEAGTVALYLDERRIQRALPANPRAQRVARRLSMAFMDRNTLYGDVLLTGIDRSGADTNVPPELITLARSPANPPRFRIR